MKLRIRGNTLRLRLTRSEVDAIGRGESVSETTAFPDGTTLQYRLVPGAVRHAGQKAGDSGFEITVEVPRDEASRWAESEEVGFSGEDAFEVGDLAVLIEKDFTCITPRAGEEELDTYPNPNIAAG